MGKEDIKLLLYFGIFASVILILVMLFFKLFLKKYEVKIEKTKIYGILSGLNNREIISLSVIIINYLFLVFLAMMTEELNTGIISACLIMSIIPWLITKNYLKTILNIMVEGISLLSLYLLSFVHNYLSGESSDLLMRISVFFIIAIIFIYFTYNLINDINEFAKTNIKKRKEGEKHGTVKKSS